ncbi:MAG: hypothetical protein M1827_003886 [Pycnora praestabilis]|nr:MAG: hypothetical protein M1827_003886 [Pycnora praestabilis]
MLTPLPSPWLLLFLGLLGPMIANALPFAKRDADFASVRTKLAKDHSGKGGDPKEKYFHESVFHPHYDGRFADKVLPYTERNIHLSAMMQAYLSTMADIGAETWLMHGSLLGWWWNRKVLIHAIILPYRSIHHINQIMPWDSDIDVMVSERTMHFLASYYNMTMYHYKTARIPQGREYMLEINPNYVNRGIEDKLNMIDARWVDTESGLFIDITTVRRNETAEVEGVVGALMVKDRHHYLEKDLFPLRETLFEDAPVLVPFRYQEILEEEYGKKALTSTVFDKKTKKPPDAELLARLRRLEGVVETLGTQIEEDDIKEISKSPKARIGVGIDDTGHHAYQAEKDSSEEIVSDPRSSMETPCLEQEMGRLVVEDGKSRYVNNSFWAKLNDEVEDIRGVLNEPSDDEDDHESPESISATSGDQQGFIFGFSSQIATLHALHPPSSQIYVYWQLYLENVDPLVKLLHAPSMEKVILQAKDNPESISRGTEALLYSIYYAVVTSLDLAECSMIMGEDKRTLLGRYRFATEQALARASFLNSTVLVTLQAFVIFLTCLRRHDDTRIVWTMTGIAIRIAQGLGVHRDGETFGLSPFETEMRRRLWWSLCILDLRASEDHGTEPTILSQHYDTKFPLNVDDSDLDPEAKHPPEEREGTTIMTFALVRFELSNVMRRINYVIPGPGMAPSLGLTTSLADKGRWLDECLQRVEERYLRHCDTSIPLDWVSVNVARLIMAKLWLMVHHKFLLPDSEDTLAGDMRVRLLITSVEVIEYSRVLETETSTTKWAWLFRTYVPVQALIFILSELCVMSRGPLVDRAWKAIDIAFANWGEGVTSSRRGILWAPMKKLYAKAQAIREKEKANSRALSEPATSVDHSLTPRLDGDFTYIDGVMPFAPAPASVGYQNEGLFNAPQASENTKNQWLQQDPAVELDMGNDDVDWADWDNMIREFQMEIYQGPGLERRPVVGGIHQWY